MEWIDVNEGLPDLPSNKVAQSYLVVVQKKGRPARIRFAKWEKKLHRKVQYVESINKVLAESNLAKWVVCLYKASEVLYWMPLPSLPISKK